MHNISVIDSPLGKLKLVVNANRLEKIELNCADELLVSNNETAQLVAAQLKAYFDSPTHLFNCPVLIQGTDFQKKVWNMLTKIPVGEIWTYGFMAKKLNTSARAVGNACRRNSIPIVVPCHRIVSARGLGGFAGQTEGRLTDIKKILLDHEGINIASRNFN